MGTKQLKDRIRELYPELIKLRRDIHQHPELGFQEHRTASVIEDYLGKLGIETQRIAGTGVVGIIQGQKRSPVIMLRADIDALPVTEESDVSFRSVTDGVMHACGHDAHTAMLLVAAGILQEIRDELPGTVKLLFQPDEERAGAIVTIREGVLSNPQVDAAFGLHIWTYLKSGQIGISSGPIMAGLDVFQISITGKGGHTGAPENSIDPVLTAAAVIQTVQSLQTREISNLKPTVIVFGKIEGGTKATIIPDKVKLEGTIRFLYNAGPESEERPTERFIRIVEGVCETHRCRCDIKIEHENIPLVNDERMTTLARETAGQLFGSSHTIVENRSLASEDFSEFTARIPGTFIFLGTADTEKGTDFPHHHSRFNIDEERMQDGVALFVQYAINYFNDSANSPRSVPEKS